MRLGIFRGALCAAGARNESGQGLQALWPKWTGLLVLTRGVEPPTY